MKANIESLLLSDVKGSSDSGWRQDSLFSFCYSLLFRYHPTSPFPMYPHDFIYSERHSPVFPCCPRAGYLTLFESRGNVNAVYKEFRKFDKLLCKLVNGSLKKGKVSPPNAVTPFSFHLDCKSRDYGYLACNASSPTGEFQTVNSSREQLWELLSADWLSQGSGPLSWQQSYHRFLQEQGVDVEMQKRASLLQLWTTQVSAAQIQMEYTPKNTKSVMPPHPFGMLEFLTQPINKASSEKPLFPLCW